MKKGLAFLLAFSLVFSLMTPFTVGATSGDTFPSGPVTVTGTSGVTVLGTAGDVLSGTLPTGANFDFTIDPLRLLDLQPGDPVPTVGNPVIEFVNNTFVFSNASSVPVLTTVELKATGDNVVFGINNAAFTDGSTSTAADILLWAEPNATVQHSSSADFVGAGKVIPFGGALEAEAHFRLQERPHHLVIAGPATDGGVVPVNRVPLTGEGRPEQFGTAIRLGGLSNANPAVDWEEVGDITISVVFGMVKAEAAVIEAPLLFTEGDTTSAYGLLGAYGSHDLVDVIAAPTVSSSSSSESEFAVIVVGGGTGATATGLTFAAGETVTINAGVAADADYVFAGWTVSGGADLDNANAAETTFEMPANEVTVTATWKRDRIAATADSGTITRLETVRGWGAGRTVLADFDFNLPATQFAGTEVTFNLLEGQTLGRTFGAGSTSTNATAVLALSATGPIATVTPAGVLTTGTHATWTGTPGTIRFFAIEVLEGSTVVGWIGIRLDNTN